MGQIGILNVGAGDTKLSFDKNNPAELIRSARIVTDMLRRGYALLVEVPDGKGGMAYQRVREFREESCEYIIADLDPIITQEGRTREPDLNPADEPPTTAPDGAPVGETRLATPHIAGGRKRGPKSRAIHASEATGVAVSRSAGG